MCMKWLLIIRHVNSVEQCCTVSTVSTVSIVSTVITRCYLHLRWYFWNGQQPNIELVALAGWSASTCSLLSWKSSGWRLVPLDRVAAREPTPLSTSPSSSRFPLQRKEIKLLHFNHCRLTCCVRRGECFPLENQFVLLVPTDLPPHLHVLFFH